MKISAHLAGNTVGAVIATAPAFRLADFTADRDSHPALKICGAKIRLFQSLSYFLAVFSHFYHLLALAQMPTASCRLDG